jgi:hypothetical protein
VSDLPTFWLPPGAGRPSASAAFGPLSLPSVAPAPAELGALAARLAASAADLRQVPLATIVAAIDRVARRWSDPALPARRALVASLPAINGSSAAMVDHIVGRMVEDWRADRLWARLQAAFADPAALDEWVAYGRPDGGAQLTRAWGPRLTLHVCAGNVPGVAIQSLIDALLVKSPSLVKVASGEPLWAAAWAALLAEELPALAESLAGVWWPGGAAEREAAALAHAEALIANASAATVADLRRRLPAHVRLLDYGSRISFALVCRELLAPEALPALAAGLAYDAALFDQQGCVSPQLVFVEAPDAAQLGALAAALDQALARLDGELPRVMDAGAATRARRLRDDLEWRELAGAPLSWLGPADGRWTIVCDPAAPFAPGAGGRSVVLRPLADLAELPALLEPLAPALQSVALAAPPHRRADLATLLAAAGLTRIAPVGRQGWPSPLWHHDGRNPLDALVRWSDLE